MIEKIKFSLLIILSYENINFILNKYYLKPIPFILFKITFCLCGFIAIFIYKEYHKINIPVMNANSIQVLRTPVKKEKMNEQLEEKRSIGVKTARIILKNINNLNNKNPDEISKLINDERNKINE